MFLEYNIGSLRTLVVRGRVLNSCDLVSTIAARAGRRDCGTYPYLLVYLTQALMTSLLLQVQYLLTMNNWTGSWTPGVWRWSSI